MKLKEGLGLVAQDLRLERLEQEVHRAGVVALEHPVTLLHAGRHEDDRHVPSALGTAHQLGQLEAIHLGHLHVDQRQGKLVLQHQLQRFAPRARLQELEVITSQQGFQHQ